MKPCGYLKIIFELVHKAGLPTGQSMEMPRALDLREPKQTRVYVIICQYQLDLALLHNLVALSCRKALCQNVNFKYFSFKL